MLTAADSKWDRVFSGKSDGLRNVQTRARVHDDSLEGMINREFMQHPSRAVNIERSIRTAFLEADMAHLFKASSYSGESGVIILASPKASRSSAIRLAAGMISNKMGTNYTQPMYGIRKQIEQQITKRSLTRKTHVISGSADFYIHVVSNLFISAPCSGLDRQVHRVSDMVRIREAYGPSVPVQVIERLETRSRSRNENRMPMRVRRNNITAVTSRGVARLLAVSKVALVLSGRMFLPC